MTIENMREQLNAYIKMADDDRVKEMFEIMMIDKNGLAIKWYDDEEFVAELDERVRRYEEGIDKGITLEEVEANLEKIKAQRSGNR